MSRDRKCNSCGFILQVNARFCTSCGTPVKKPNFCQKCNGELKPNANFCTRCGTKVIDETGYSDELGRDQDKKSSQPQKEIMDEEMLQVVDDLYEIGIPNEDNLDEYIEVFDKVRKSDYSQLSKTKVLAILTNGASAILKHQESRPYLIKAIQAYKDAYILALELDKEDLANQIRYVLANLNIKFADLIPQVSKRSKYYDEAKMLIKELVREVEDGDIIGKDAVRVYLLNTELLQRKSDIKHAIYSIETALKLAEDYPKLKQEVLILQAELFMNSARYEEAYEIIKSVNEELLSNPAQKELIELKIMKVLDDDVDLIDRVENLYDHPSLTNKERVNLKKQLANLYLEKNSDKSLKLIDSIFDEELDPAWEKSIRDLKEIMEKHIKKMDVNYAIKENNAKRQIRDRMNSLVHSESKENWDGVVFNARRILEILEDYSHIDQDNSKKCDIFFRLGAALFKLEEYEQALAYFDSSIEYYEQGIGDKVQHTTAIKYLVDSKVHLGLYDEAYKNSKDGLKLAQEISHAGLIQEFEERTEKLHPDRIELKKTFDNIIFSNLEDMADVSNFYRLFKLFNLDTTRAQDTASLFLPLTLSILRSDLYLSAMLLRNRYIEQISKKKIDDMRVRAIYLNPIGVFEELPKFKVFTNFMRNISEESIPIHIIQIVFIEAALQITVRSMDDWSRRNFNMERMMLKVLETLKNMPIQIVVLLIVIATIKAVEIRI